MKSLKTLGAVALLSTSMLGAATSFAAEKTSPSDQKETPVQAKFKLPENGGSNVDPENPGTDDGQNKPLNPEGPFGIAYVPAAFQTQNFDNDGVALAESGQQDFQFTNTDARVGVKDKTRTPGGWTLSASLSWTGKALPGSTITFTQGQGVKINEGKGKYASTSDVTAGSSTTINDSATQIMTAKDLSGDNFYDATYDDQLVNPTLHIQDASKVQAGTYQGNVTWKLTAAAV